MPVETLNTYSLSKFSGENLMKLYFDLYGLRTVSLRYFNAYGPRQPASGQYAPVIGIFKRQKDNGESLTIVGDGNQTRDFIHVSDIVNANIKAATIDTNTYGEVYNVGTGVHYSIKKIASMISDNHIHIPPRPAEARFSCANIHKIKSVYEWTPQINLETWIKENL
jgi:UDP-glucose 4-epimerase